MRPVFIAPPASVCPAWLVNAAMFGSAASTSPTAFWMPDHVVEADALNRLGLGVEASLVLARQEAFRHQGEQVDGRDDQRDRHGHRHRAVPQRGAQA